MQSERKGGGYTPAGKSRRFQIDDLEKQPKLRSKRRKRNSWRCKKTELEQMSIDDLRDYISDTEH
jgi:hypothetical protein